jgi:hypothetical protein
VDDADGSPPSLNANVETEVKELMGLFDLPAFARRGQDLEVTLRNLHDRCRRTRAEFLDMVQVRLRQWSRAATGPHAWPGVFSQSIEHLWPLSGADQPLWAQASAPLRRQQLIGADLVAALIRFNRRWIHFLERLNLEPTNLVISQYNRYYVLEKECVMGSARLAARHFQPVPLLSPSTLQIDYPLLPVPDLVAKTGTFPKRRLHWTDHS